MRWRDISSRPKCEIRPTWMRARSFFRRSFSRFSTCAVVALLLHVDEVDDDKAGKVAQAELAGDFLGGFEIGLQRGVLDRVFARRAARIDVDRDQRFGLVDDDVAAGLQRHLRLQHAVELGFDAGTRKNRMDVAIGLNHLGVARHQHLHEVFRFTIAFFAGNEDLADILVVEVADRALDQASLPRRRGRGRSRRASACGRSPTGASDIRSRA